MADPVARLNKALEGRYRLEREIGQGGMATVYLADDLRHERKIALKVLKPELAAVVGAERFLTEIKTTANLQHPHILPLFDSGEADRFLFYVMPYVAGESLRDRLDREKQLPVDEAVAIAKKVAGALHAAHGRGVIHRDIKPANILLAGGEPLVADFGIALAVQEAGGGRLTETGLSVGTPYYMSPEQATGEREPNAASDVYSLGCVLYETLVGEPPYAGSSAQAVLGKIIAGDAPRAKDGRPAVPANVDAAVQKALEKLPADRFSTTEQFATALADPGFRVSPAHLSSKKRGQPSIRLIWPTLAAAFGVVALFGWLRPGSTPPVPVSFDFHTPDGYDMVDGVSAVLAVSPDGRSLAYRNGNGVYVRELDEFEGRPLGGTEGVYHAFFSPDGETLGLLDGGFFRQVPVGGGPVVDLLAERTEAEGGHWGEDGRIVYAAAWGYSGIRAATPGEPGTQQLTSVNAEAGESAHRWPQLLPDGLLLYTSIGPSWVWQDARVVVLDPQSGETTTIAERATYGRFHHDGFVVYGNADGQLLAVSFDTRTKAIGTPQLIATDVMVAYWGGAVSFALAERGNTLAFVEGSNFERHSLVWVDRQGRRSPPIGPPLTIESLSLSSDGRRVAMDVFDRRGSDIYIGDLDRWDPSRLTLDVAQNEAPVWSPDGQSLAYTVAGVGGSTSIVIQALTPGSTPETIAERPFFAEVTSWSPDGLWIAFQEAADSSGDLYAVRTDGSGDIRPIATDQLGIQFDAKISPNGRWVVYMSETSGRREIYIDGFPGLSARRQVTTGGGEQPRWIDDGEVTFVRGDTVFAQTVHLESSFEPVGGPVPLFHFSEQDFPFFPVYDFLFRYDASPGGQRFLVRVHRPETLAREGKLMTGWLDQLERGS